MILKVPDDCRCAVFDANGVELMYCIWCDTETGEAVHYKRSGGVMSWDMIVNEAGEKILATEWRQHPAPLRVVRV